MYPVKTTTFFDLSANQCVGDCLSLDAIVEKVYGRPYRTVSAAQCGNDTTLHFDYDKETVDDYLEDIRECDGDPIGDWLALDPKSFEQPYIYHRKAPAPDVMVADLINKGHLPYGNYQIYISW